MHCFERSKDRVSAFSVLRKKHFRFKGATDGRKQQKPALQTFVDLAEKCESYSYSPFLCRFLIPCGP